MLPNLHIPYSIEGFAIVLICRGFPMTSLCIVMYHANSDATMIYKNAGGR